MIYVKFTDRLGNNLFQFGAAKSIDPDVTIVVETPEHFEYVKPFLELFYKGASVVVGAPGGLIEYKEVEHHHSQIYLTQNPVLLKGYFQSPKYLRRKIILEQYKIPENVKKSIRSVCDIDFGDYVSLHVRRGDYKTVQYKHPLCNLDYFKSAVKYFGEERKYLVISDDLDWCKNNLCLNNVIFFDGGNQINDLYVQSLCADNIISNSSFSWWGAYLNDNVHKRVVAPTPWFGTRSKLNTLDLLPPEYHIISYKRKWFVKLTESIQFYRDLVSHYTK